ATDQYDSWPTLANPVNDSRALEQDLKALYGFEVERLEGPTVAQIKQTLIRYQSLSFGPDDQLFIFFAGHGAFVDAESEGFVIGRDSNRDVEPAPAIAHYSLAKLIDKIPANHILVALDVCYGGTFDARLAAATSRGDEFAELDPQQILVRKLKYRTRLFVSSGGKEYVPDGRPGMHSPFAR